MPEHESTLENIQFLKLGGSLITQKDLPYTPRLEVIDRLAREIAAVLSGNSTIKLLLGHGSGSFGHVPAQKHGTRQGVATKEQWYGFVKVWRQAAALNRVVVDALARADLPAVSFPPSASVIARDGEVYAWDLSPIRSALKAGILPVVYGDVVFDRARGGTILSTEDLFSHLACNFVPDRILIAGLEPGVWSDFPDCQRLIPVIDPFHCDDLIPGLGDSTSTDVTGGMASKVLQSIELTSQLPGLEIRIFSGLQPGSIVDVLQGGELGTVIRAAR